MTLPAAVDDTDIDVAGAAALLGSAAAVTVLCHINPDADAIGSALALGIVLERKNIPVQVAFGSPADLPESMAGLPGTHLLVAPDEVVDVVDLLVTVDCGSKGRLGRLGDRLEGAKTSLVVDHHASNTRYGSANLVDPAAESTTVLICRILDAWGVPIDADIAHCIYAGLVTDTGSFRWGTASTHEIAARLLRTGIDADAITRPLLDTHPFGWLPMLGSVLSSAQLLPDAAAGLGVVYAVIHLTDSEGLRPEELESVVDIVRTASEAEVAVVLKEMADGTWSASMRSKGAVDVSLVAGKLAGGGHRRAAGFTAVGTDAEVISALLDVLG